MTSKVQAPGARLPQLVGIQYLRGVAALAVVVFHALESTQSKFGVGAAGVDLFFVISGFIMWTVTEQESRPGVFVWRRLIRIAPLYWFATLLAVLAAFVKPGFMWAPPFDAADVARSLAFIPYIDAWGREFPVLTPGWTLNYEMFFYAVFALVLFAPRRWQLGAITAALTVLMLAGIWAPQNAALATYTSLNLVEFLAGVWLARAWQKGWVKGRVGGWALMALGVAVFAVEQALGVREGPLRALYWGLPALAIVAGALMIETAGGVPAWRLPKALGDASYSIYLFHLFVVAAGERVFAGAPLAVRVIAIVVGSALAGWIMFRLVERPLTAALKRAPSLRMGRPPALGAASSG